MNHQEELKERQRLSRRKFFGSAGTFIADAAVTASAASTLLVAGKGEASKAQAVTWPYPYVKLDPEDVRVRAYLGYYKGK